MATHPILLLAALATLVCAQSDSPLDPNNYFDYPPPAGPKFGTDPSVYLSNPVFVQGVAQPIRWFSNLTVDLRLVQEGPDNNQLTLARNNSEGIYNWNGNIGTLNLAIGNVFFFAAWDALSPDLDAGPVFFSHYINITVSSNGSPSTTSIASSTLSTSESATTFIESATISSSSSTSFAASATANASSSTTPIPIGNGTASSSSSSNAAALGGGIGGGIGGALIIVAAVIALFVYRSRKRKAGTAAAQSETSEPKIGDIASPHPSYQLDDASQRYQMDDTSARPYNPHNSYQLDDTSVRPGQHVIHHVPSYGGGP